VSGGGRRARDSTVLNDAVATQDTITQLAERLLRRADRRPPRQFGIHESDGAPDEQEGRPKHEPPGYRVHDGAVKCGLGVRRHFPALTQAHRAVPSWALLRVGA
jgi:hypothetical protein